MLFKGTAVNRSGRVACESTCHLHLVSLNLTDMSHKIFKPAPVPFRGSAYEAAVLAAFANSPLGTAYNASRTGASPPLAALADNDTDSWRDYLQSLPIGDDL